MEYTNKVLSGLKGAVQDSILNLIDENVERERQLNIRNVVDAMLELNNTDDEIVAMLQKHWDMRLSEAKSALRQGIMRRDETVENERLIQ